MTDPELPTKPARKRTARTKAADPTVEPAAPEAAAGGETAPETAAPAKRTRARKAVAGAPAGPDSGIDGGTGAAADAPAPAKRARKAAAAEGEAAPAPAKRTRSRKAAPAIDPADAAASADAAAPAGEATPREVAATVAALDELPAAGAGATEPAEEAPKRRRSRAKVPVPAVPVEDPADVAVAPAAAPPVPVAFQPPTVTFQPPPDEEEVPEEAEPAPARTRTRTPRIIVEEPETEAPAEDETPEEAERRRRRRRGRRGRGRGKGGEEAATETDEAAAEPAADTDTEGESDTAAGDEAGSTTRRRRRRRRGAGEAAEPGPDDPPRTVVKVREPRKAEHEVRGVSGSTRLEAKRQRRREGRDTRRRPAIVSESEFLARREAVDRVMLVRQGEDRTQIAVLEDDILVEHYVTRATATSYAGNVYLGKVQNVLPSMEAAFVDIGKGRNAVLYAGEVNYDASALEGRAPRIEQALKSGQQVVVQVTKDPIGHKGARLTSQISLPGRYMVYVPEQSMTGISRKLPDTERARLKTILKAIKPEGGGLIVRTAAEGASEEELTADLDRLKAQWEVIEKKAKKETAPALLYEEPDLVIRVVRDMFNEDFSALVVEGDDDYDTIHSYLDHLAPDLMPKLSRWDGDRPLFEAYRVDEQIYKALDRKVSLPSGGSLVIDRTEAMTVVDVNTGKFTGKGGGNLEETVTRNNLEAAEEVVRQLRLRDIGGIIVVDFIDMILESNRELVARRLKECLGRDRTKHQVAEITSLGLLQMTRKRIAQGLHETFTEQCEHCGGRGVHVTMDPPAKQPKGAKPPTPAQVARATNGKAREAEVEADGAVAEADVPATPVAAAEGDAPAAETGGEGNGGGGRRRRRGGRGSGRGGRDASAEQRDDEQAPAGASAPPAPAPYEPAPDTGRTRAGRGAAPEDDPTPEEWRFAART